jgi:monoamine oxidase
MPGMPLTRREFLVRVGHAGGYSATFATMQSLGLLPATTAVSTLNLPRGAGRGVKVVILGAGISGLVSAYELAKAGFDCTLLEARGRPGGRNWTVRNGTTVEFIDGTRQTATYVDSKSYFNAGPARLPSVHKTILGYCKELGIPLEVFVNANRNSLMISQKAFSGNPVEQRQVINDTRGHIAELLAKTIRQGALDEGLTQEDHERLLAFLRTFGDLNQELTYQGSQRAGVSQLPGAGDVAEELRPPLELHALLDANFWSGAVFEEGFDQQMPMFQPAGGMDHIPYAFAKKLGRIIQYRSVVKEIRKTANGVRIIFAQAGSERAILADYCIATLPVNILKGIGNDFSPQVRKAIEDTRYSDSYKIAWESKRFWETEYNIYGGISWLADGPINMVWYPSGYLHNEFGVLLSGYGMQSIAAFNELPNLESKLTASRAAVERLHPGHGKDLQRPMYVVWEKIPFNQGAWISGASGEYHKGPYQAFLEPDGRIYFAGDFCSHLLTWQEGAALSAHRTVNMISERVRTGKA